MVRSGWVPPRSPYGLIQEDLFPSEWHILCSCIFLNLTSRKTADPILKKFFMMFEQPSQLLTTTQDEVGELIAPLGLKTRRVQSLFSMSEQFVKRDWISSRELSGIGEYGGTTHDMFCLGKLPSASPSDGALELYWRWAHANKDQCDWL